MRKLIYMLIMLLASVVIVNAKTDEKKKRPTEKPNFEKIKSEIRDPKSRYYYPKLMEKHLKMDTTMNIDEYRYLYLGAMFQEDYNPYRTSSFADTRSDLYYKEKHTRAELDTIVAYAEKTLEDDPFDLEQMSFLIYAYRNKGKNNIANIWQYKLNHILEAIVSTGTGLDADNAWYVINPRHEYNIANFRNRTVSEQEFKEPYFEYIYLVPVSSKGSKAPDGYYFNIQKLLEEYYRKFPDEI